MKIVLIARIYYENKQQIKKFFGLLIWVPTFLS